MFVKGSELTHPWCAKQCFLLLSVFLWMVKFSPKFLCLPNFGFILDPLSDCWFKKNVSLKMVLTPISSFTLPLQIPKLNSLLLLTQTITITLPLLCFQPYLHFAKTDKCLLKRCPPGKSKLLSFVIEDLCHMVTTSPSSSISCHFPSLFPLPVT